MLFFCFPTTLPIHSTFFVMDQIGLPLQPSTLTPIIQCQVEAILLGHTLNHMVFF